MYILISVFAFYAMGIISYEHGFFSWFFIAVVVMLSYNSFISKKFIYNSVIVAFLLLSAINCNYNSKSVLAQHINENMIVTVKIKNKNISDENSDFFSYNGILSEIGGMVLENGENTIVYFDKSEKIQENSIIKFNGNVSGAEFGKNELLFNYKNYLRAKKINAVIFAEGSPTIIKENYSILNDVSFRFRKYAETTFYNNLSKKNAEIILPIILSESDFLEDDLYGGVKEMGLAHIFAVSGTHIVLMYGFLLFFFKLAGLKRRIAWVVSWSLLWIYGFLIGLPVSVMRALVMFTLLFGSEVFYRKYSSLNAIGLAALVLTVYNPYWIFDAGFLLSFSAALSLILFNRYISNHISEDKIVFVNLFMYLFLQSFMLPVISYYFNYIPVMGVLYNLLLLPIFTVILAWGFILLILSGIFSFLLAIPFSIFNYVLTSLRYIIYFSDKFAFNGITIKSMSDCEIIFFYIAVFIVLYLINIKSCCLKKYVWISLISFYAVTFVAYPLFYENLYFNTVDAGQGLFLTLKYKNTHMVFDCGSTSSSNFGEYTAVPYLKKRGIDNIDCVFISHWDEDHCSGLSNLLSSDIEIKNIFSSSRNEKFEEAVIIEKNGRIEVDDALIIEVLWPEGSYVSESSNNSSLVLLIGYRNMNILLPGDIEEEVENMILDDIVKSDIIIVPHHGSKTSSSKNFVDKVKPKLSVLSYGRNNYGIPDEEVLKRYEDAKSIVLSTFEHGEINFVLNEGNLYYNTYTGEVSPNYYKLYFEWIIPKIFIFVALLAWIWIKKEECYELQDYNRFN